MGHTERSNQIMFEMNDGLQHISIRLINRTEPNYSTTDGNQTFVETLLPVPSTPEPVNVSSESPPPPSWSTVIFSHPDVLLAFALIIFYAIFVLFILIIVIRIVFTIMTTGSSFKMAANSSEALSEDYDDTSSRTRGTSGGGLASKARRGLYLYEMTSYAVERTNSPSIIEES